MPDPQLTLDHEDLTDTSTSPTAFTVGANRRVLLQRVGLAALAGGGALALAACGGDETGAGAPTSTAPSAAEPSSSAPSPSTSTSASESASSAPAKPPAGTKVAKADVKVGGGVILKDAKLVVTQPEEGTFKAFDATCTHQGCLVSEIAGTNIDCLCHGSKFSIVDGSVTNPPANAPLAAKKVTESGSDLYIA